MTLREKIDRNCATTGDWRGRTPEQVAARNMQTRDDTPECEHGFPNVISCDICNEEPVMSQSVLPELDQEFWDWRSKCKAPPAISDLLEKRAECRERQLLMERSVLSMAVLRLGGKVEGNPTARHNFLQRIDTLVELEDGSKG